LTSYCGQTQLRTKSRTLPIISNYTTSRKIRMKNSYVHSIRLHIKNQIIYFKYYVKIFQNILTIFIINKSVVIKNVLTLSVLLTIDLRREKRF
jgi:hypothetical protein